MYRLATTPYAIIVIINIVITLETRHHCFLCLSFLRAFSLCSMILEPSDQRSLFGSTLTSGVPSARQNANAASM
jgi:hypothetical protein